VSRVVLTKFCHKKVATYQCNNIANIFLPRNAWEKRGGVKGSVAVSR
jgi:hypothetical protein